MQQHQLIGKKISWHWAK